MARLFASLYLWIAVALIASTALLDALFFNAQPPGPGIDATRIALQHAKPDAALLNDLRHSGIPARFIPTDLIAWPAQSRTALAQGIHGAASSLSCTVSDVAGGYICIGNFAFR